MCLHGMVKILWNWILFFGKITIFSQKFKKTAFKMAPFWGFFVLGGSLYAKRGKIAKRAVFARFRYNSRKGEF